MQVPRMFQDAWLLRMGSFLLVIASTASAAFVPGSTSGASLLRRGLSGAGQQNPRATCNLRPLAIVAQPRHVQQKLGLSMSLRGGVDADSRPADTNESVLVVGGRGSIGKAVIRELIKQGTKVRALTREPDAVDSEVTGEVEWICGDLNDPSTITKETLKGISRIIFCPGAQGRKDPENNRRVYEEAIPLLLSQGEGAVKRFVYLSSTCVSWPAALPDDEVPRGRAITQPFLLRVYKFKRRGEAALRRSGASYAIVRVNSPVSREHFDKLLGGAEPGEERIVVHADDDQDIDGLGPTRMYVGNLASVLVDAAFNEATQGKTFGVATMLESPGARGAGAWREEVARVPLDSERDDPWPEDLFEPAPRETCA